MGLPAHARGSLSSRMSAIFQSCQLFQQLLAACGLVHPLHHLGGGDSLRVEALAPGHRLARIAHRRLVLLVLLAFLGPALGAVLGHCCRAGVPRLFGGCGPVEVVEDVVDPAKVVFGQTQPCGGPCAQDLVEAAHGNAGLCAETVAKADILPVAAGRLGLGVPGHLVDGVLQTVEVVGVQKRKIKFLTTNVHVVLLLHAYGGIACDGVADPGGRVLFGKVVKCLRDADALEVLKQKKNCIILVRKECKTCPMQFRSLLNGVLMQEKDLSIQGEADLEPMTEKKPTAPEVEDLLFANKIVKNSKSNAITLVKNKQLCASGIGQTSRVDSLKQAIEKAVSFNFDLNGAVMASDAFFPFADCVEIADKAGITAVIQPGGSINDKLSVDYCNEHGLAMVKTGIRHFKH